MISKIKFPPIPLSPSTSLEVHALNYWVETFATWPTELLDFGQEYGSFALGRWSDAGMDTSLHLAVSAFSLAAFGRAKRLDVAIQNAKRVYSEAMTRTREEIARLSNQNIDQLLIATAMMGSYHVCLSSFPIA